MKIINTYDEILSHYNMKLNHAREELEDALRSLGELEVLAAEGWQGRAAEAFGERLEQLRHEMTAPREEMEEIRRLLAGLGRAIEEEIRLLMEEQAKSRNAGPI